MAHRLYSVFHFDHCLYDNTSTIGIFHDVENVFMRYESTISSATISLKAHLGRNQLVGSRAGTMFSSESLHNHSAINGSPGGLFFKQG